MNKILLQIIILIYGSLAFSFEPFDAHPDPDAQSRIEISKGLAHNKKDLSSFAQNRYGFFGDQALKRLAQLGDDFKSLIFLPGVILKLSQFEQFVNSKKLHNSDPWEVAELFSNSLGNKTVYRGLILNDEEFENIKRKGIESNALREKADLAAYEKFSLPMELLLRVRPDSLRLWPKLPDRTLSITSDPAISRAVGMGFAKEKDIGKKHLYIFKAEIPAMDNLTISGKNIRLCSYKNRDNEQFNPGEFSQSSIPRKIRLALCKGAFFPNDIESFAEFVIEPTEIKEYEKIDLSADAMKEARKSLHRVIKRQTCQEIHKLKWVSHPEINKEIQELCARPKKG